MADQQGRGLQIALVVTIVLLIVMMVLSGVFYQNFSKARTDALTLAQKVTEANQTQRMMAQNIQSLLQAIGIPEPEKFVAQIGEPADQPDKAGNTAWARVNAYLIEHQTKFGNDTSLSSLFAVIDRLDAELEKYKQNYETLASEIRPVLERVRQKLEEEKQSVEGELRNQLAQAQEELRRVQQSIDEQIQEMTAQVQQYRRNATKAVLEAQQIAKNLQAERQEHQRVVDAMSAQIRQLRRLTETKAYLAEPDGEIIAVDAAEGYCILSVGAKDNVRPMTRFSVWGPDQVATPYWRRQNEEAEQEAVETLGEQNRDKAKLFPLQGPKGYVEVIEVTGDHTSRARIRWFDTTRPLAANDKIYNPVWSPRHKHRVAIVGIFDLDGDGQDDRPLLKSILRQQGCEIDLEILPDGTMQGEISALTDWLVLGKVPGITVRGDALEETDSGNVSLSRLTQAAQEAVRQATQFGVPAMSEHEFYDFLGYQPYNPIYDPSRYNDGREASARERQPVTSGGRSTSRRPSAASAPRYFRF